MRLEDARVTNVLRYIGFSSLLVNLKVRHKQNANYTRTCA